MAKRRLSKNQTRRIQSKQRQFSENASLESASSEFDESSLNESNLGPEQAGRVIAHFGTQVDVENEARETRRCFMRANLQSVITGDHVVWRDGPDCGVVVSLEERRSLICRPDSYGKLKPVAANVDQILVTVAPKPELHSNLIDRYIVVAETTGITPIILFNKSDLVDENTSDNFDEILERYTSLGYQVIKTSAKKNINLQELTQVLKQKTSIFVGQSGVGKSSIIQQLVPEHDIQVGQLSDAKIKGRHTTTHSQLFHFIEGGECIDSPGIREFGLWHLTEDDVINGFIELREASQHCKFRDCRHEKEPGCAIISAIEAGAIAEDRFQNFKRIISSLNDVDVRALDH